MSTGEAVGLVVSFLGGGLVVGILNLVHSLHAERAARRTSALTAQLEKLYGPLHFFAAQNRSLLKLNDALQEAHKAEFVDKKWSTSDLTQKNLSESSAQTLDLANAYMDLLIENNDCILRIMRENFAYIDPEDAELFGEFIVDYVRHKTEIDDKGRLKTPMLIYRRMGDIFFLRPAFVDRVEQKVKSKREELASYERRAGG